jgi:enamine deaminase RidA (YjgF/YER057c/UK114 family)
MMSSGIFGMEPETRKTPPDIESQCKLMFQNIRRVMEAAGLTPGRIDRLVGHADRMPLLPDDPLNAMNRRITMLVRRQGTGPDVRLEALPKILAPGSPRS